MELDVDCRTSSNGNERRLDRDEDIYGYKDQKLIQTEARAQNYRGSRRLVLMTVCLGIICVLLLLFIILQHIFITAERESLFKSHKNTVEEFNQTINSLEANYTENKLKLETRVNNLTAEKKQLQRSFDTLSQMKLELETRVSNLTAEKGQLQNSTNSLSQKKVELENKVTSLSEELKTAYGKGYQWGWFFVPIELSWFESRQYCRDRGADLIIINSEEKQRFITSLVKERVWIGLTDIQQEGNMKWVDNSPLRQGFWYSAEPNDAGGNEDCIELISLFPVLNWNDIQCSDKRKGICEK